ncbi:phage tail protein, partial [Escherichia coli]
MPVSRYLCIFINVGLGEAAKRNVGTGSGQIPDMSSFSGSIASKGYQKLPGGLII